MHTGKIALFCIFSQPMFKLIIEVNNWIKEDTSGLES